jgi:hypothetical protein
MDSYLSLRLEYSLAHVIVREKIFIFPLPGIFNMWSEVAGVASGLVKRMWRNYAPELLEAMEKNEFGF